MKQIHMIGLGGSIKGANIEVHDLQFVLGDSLEDCIPEIKKRWYGESLHIDSDTLFREFNGYRVSFTEVTDQNLYLIVYGGYDSNQIDEVHTYNIVIAETSKQAEQLAKQNMSQFAHIDHVDNVVDLFDHLGFRFGWIADENASFANNPTKHMYYKLKSR